VKKNEQSVIGEEEICVPSRASKAFKTASVSRRSISCSTTDASGDHTSRSVCLLQMFSTETRSWFGGLHSDLV